MMYFKVTINVGEEGIKRIREEKNGYIHERTDEFNFSSGDGRACLSAIDDTSITILINIPFKRKDETESLASNYLKSIGVEWSGEYTIEEIDGSSFYASLMNAERKNYVLSGEFLRSRSVARLVHSDGVSDYLIAPGKPDPLIESAVPSLSEEINRITSSSRIGFYGHPVHYIFLIDSDRIIDYSLSILLSSLYENGRLLSRRVVSICRKKDLSEPDTTPGVAIMRPARCAYETNGGGTVVLFPSSFKADGGKIGGSEFILDDFVTLLSTKPKDVLSVVVLPQRRKDDGVRIINQMMGKAAFVVIKERELPTDDVIKYLEKKAEEDNVVGYSSSLVDEYIGGRGLSSYEEVSAFYDNWYNRALLDKLYPEYKDCAGVLSFCKKDDVKFGKKESSYSILKSLIGLDRVKSLIDDVINLNKYNKMLLEKNKMVINVSRHMVFTGNPGTAKTTVARLFAGIMKEEGILAVGSLIEVGRQDLVGKYVGWTAKTVESTFQRAKGSVLFIDEAYSLSDEKTGSYGDEAINTIVQCMENYRDDTIVIFAGYPDKMNLFLDRNPGLRSRISFNINFDDYSSEELYSILLLMCKKDGVEIDPGCRERVLSIIEEGKEESDYGNGRFIRNIYEKARIKAVNRIMKYSSFEDVVLTEEDFAPASVIEDKKKERKSIGFNIF